MGKESYLDFLNYYLFFNSRVTTNKLLLLIIIILELAILGGVVYYKFFRSKWISMTEMSFSTVEEWDGLSLFLWLSQDWTVSWDSMFKWNGTDTIKTENGSKRKMQRQTWATGKINKKVINTLLSQFVYA